MLNIGIFELIFFIYMGNYRYFLLSY